MLSQCCYGYQVIVPSDRMYISTSQVEIISLLDNLKFHRKESSSAIILTNRYINVLRETTLYVSVLFLLY